MALLDYFRRLFPQNKTASPAFHIRSLPSGRASADNADSNFFGNLWTLAPPATYEDNWQIYSLDVRNLDYLSPAKLMEVMADLSPELSRAIWDYLRLCNPGWEVKALRIGSDEIDERAQAATLAFLDVLDDRHGAADVVFGRIFLGPFLRGAFSAELVLDERGRMPLDLATPDPASIRFRKRSDPVLGEVWQAGQWQGPNFVPLDIPTFRYVPIDPFPASPYGRPLAAPALFVCLFLIGLLHDLRRVVRQQGYPRLDISIDTKTFIEKAPSMMESAEKFQAFITPLVAEVQRAFSQLKPDDAFIHTDMVTMNEPVGAMGGSLAGIGEIIAALERMAIRALKTMPLLMAAGQGASEGEANRQFELYAQSVKSLQHYAETMLERLLGLALEAQGIQATVVFRFAEMRAAEALRDAQTEAMQIANAKSKYEQGWVSQDEASEAITGHPADVPTPRAASGSAPELVLGDGDGEEDLNQDDQPNRAVWIAEIRAARDAVADVMRRVSVNGKH